MRHSLARRFAGLLALSALGCSGSGSDSPLAPSSLPSVPQAIPIAPISSVESSLGSAVQQGDLHVSALAIYTLDIDPVALTATSRLKETRSGQANDDLYLLSIDSFLNADSFTVSGITGTASTIDLDYTVRHPFPAPSNPTGTPNGSTNRADLGIAGMVLFLVDVASATGNTYFTDRVAHTAIVSNADAYYAPGGLLTVTGIANTFPYRQIVDEVAGGTGSRAGISNVGDVTGNFGTDGWTRSEFGPSTDGWTGYGVLHQGQASTNTVAFDKASLSGGFSLDVAMIAKYNDPRGGANAAQKKANRLPPAAADASLFAYRMPHGALDVSKIRLDSIDGQFIPNTISAVDFTVWVDDFDARATETVATDLSADAAFNTVAVGESGLPTLEVCIPGVLGDATVTADISTVVDDDSAAGGDVGQDSGAPGDALYYNETVTKAAVGGQVDGDYTGMFRATDPEIGLVIGLDETLAPLPTAPEPVTYQSFSVSMEDPNSPPFATFVSLTSANPMLSGTAPAANITTIQDNELDPIDVLIDWGNGAGFQLIASGLTSPYPNQTPIGPQMNNADLVADTINVIVRLDDGTDQTDYPLSYQLGPNRSPLVTGIRSLANPNVATPATFTMNAGTGTATDPEGDAVTFTIANNANGDQPTFAAFPNTANTTPIAAVGPVVFTVYANDPLHATTSGTAYPAVNGNVTSGVQIGWAYTFTSSTASTELIYDIEIDPAGNVWGLGEWTAAAPGIDFGDGLTAPPTLGSKGYFLVKLGGAGGNFLLKRVWSATTTLGRPNGLAVDSAGNVYAAMTFGGTLGLAALGGGAVDQVVGGTRDMAVVKFDPAGNFLGMVRSNDLLDNYLDQPTGANSSTLYYGFAGQSLALNTATNQLLVAVNPVTATAPGTADFGGTTVTTNGGSDAVLVGYNTAAMGPANIAASFAVNLSTSTGTTNHRIQCLTVDSTGNIVLGGVFDGATTTDFGGGGVASLGLQDAWLAKRTSAGAYVAGSQRTFGTIGNDTLSSIDTDASNIYIGGSWASAAAQLMTIGAPLGNMTATSATEGYVACISSGNVPVWQRNITGTAAEHVSGGVDVFGTNLFVGGLMSSTNSDWGYAPPWATAGSTDAIIAKYDAATGNTTGWTRRVATTGFDYIYSTEIDTAGNAVFCTRHNTAGTVDFDPGAGTSNRTISSTDPGIFKVSGATGEFF